MRTHARAVLGIAASIAIAAAGCGDADDGGATQTTSGAASGDEPVKVMIVGPWSAKGVVPFANYPDIAKATAAAIAKAKDPAQRPIDLVVCDDAADPNRNLKCSRDAIAQDVDVVVTENQASAAGVQVLEQAKIPVISVLGFEDDELTSSNVFNITGGAPGIAAAAAGVLVEGADPAKIGIVAQNDAPSRTAVKGAEQVLSARGTKAARTTYVDETATDLAPAALASTRGGIDGVIALPQYNVLQAYMKAIGQAGISGVAFATSDLNLPPAVVSTLGEPAEGMYIGAIYKPLTDLSDPAVKRFIDDLTAADPKLDPRKELLPWAAQGLYVGLKVASHVASMVDGEPTAASMLEAMPKLKDYETGLVAPLSFDQPATSFPGVTRVFNTKMLVGRVRDGKVVVADPDAWVDYFGAAS